MARICRGFGPGVFWAWVLQRGVGEQSCRRATQAFVVDIYIGLQPGIWSWRQQMPHGPARGF